MNNFSDKHPLRHNPRQFLTTQEINARKLKQIYLANKHNSNSWATYGLVHRIITKTGLLNLKPNQLI